MFNFGYCKIWYLCFKGELEVSLPTWCKCQIRLLYFYFSSSFVVYDFGHSLAFWLSGLASNTYLLFRLSVWEVEDLLSYIIRSINGTWKLISLLHYNSVYITFKSWLYLLGHKLYFLKAMIVFFANLSWLLKMVLKS